jgi:cytoskeleton protein RodZ
MPPFDLHKIGQLLKNSREEKGITVADVAKGLFITKRIIGAIESGDWDDLPPPVYVKAFVTQYAALLHIADAVEAELALTVSQPLPEAQRVTTAMLNEGAPKPRGPAKKIIAGTAIAGIVVVFFIVRNVSKSTLDAPPVGTTPVTPSVEEPVPAPSVQTAPVTPPVQSTSVPSVEPTPAPVQEQGRPVPEEKKLTILCHERTWVRIVIDGEERKEFMLNPKDAVMLSARERFDLVIGNAGGVALLYNGKDTGFAGKSGEVRTVSLP